MTEDEIKKIVRGGFDALPNSSSDRRIMNALDDLLDGMFFRDIDVDRCVSAGPGTQWDVCFHEGISAVFPNGFHVLPDGCDNPKTVMCCYVNKQGRLYFRHHKPGKCPDSTYRTIEEGSE